MSKKYVTGRAQKKALRKMLALSKKAFVLNNALRQMLAELSVTSVIFHGRKPVSEMPNYYATADAMLVTMKKDPVLSMMLPGKVQSYMAAGKPMIGVSMEKRLM